MYAWWLVSLATAWLSLALCFTSLSTLKKRGSSFHSLPLGFPKQYILGVKFWTVRLACVKHAASVRPEPGSNSPIKSKN